MGALDLILMYLMVARITRFLTDDFLADPIRRATETRFGEDSKMAYLINCPWCVSIWIGLVVAAFALHFHEHNGYIILASGLAASYVHGIISTNLDN